MQNKLRLSALDADVVIDGDTVFITNGAGENVQVSKEEWVFLREKLRFDDVIDYKCGETPMTVYQLQFFLELIDKKKRSEAEQERLLAEIRAKAEGIMNTSNGFEHGESPTTDFQKKQIIEMVYQILKANFELGKKPEEILEFIAALKKDN